MKNEKLQTIGLVALVMLGTIGFIYIGTLMWLSRVHVLWAVLLSVASVALIESMILVPAAFIYRKWILAKMFEDNRKFADEKALDFLRDLRQLLKKHQDVYSLVVRADDEGNLFFSLDVVSDYGDPDDWFGRLDTPLTVRVDKYKCSNLYDHTLDYIIQRMEDGEHYITNPMESERGTADESDEKVEEEA